MRLIVGSRICAVDGCCERAERSAPPPWLVVCRKHEHAIRMHGNPTERDYSREVSPEEVGGLTIPSYSLYRLKRQDDGRWGIATLRGSRRSSAQPGDFLAGSLQAAKGEPGRFYRRFGCTDDSGHKRDRLLAWFVLAAHRGLPKDGEVVRHLNDDPSCDEVWNLAWGSPTENEADKTRNRHRPVGQEHHWALLTEDDALSIITRVRAGERPSEIHEGTFKGRGVSYAAVLGCARGRTWAHLHGD